jgi:hypothetical protein
MGTRQVVEVRHSILQTQSTNTDSATVLNARIRRIDLTCKLLGPLLVALINGASTMIAIYTTLAMNIASVVTEYICIARVGDRGIISLHYSS